MSSKDYNLPSAMICVSCGTIYTFDDDDRAIILSVLLEDSDYCLVCGGLWGTGEVTNRSNTEKILKEKIGCIGAFLMEADETIFCPNWYAEFEQISCNNCGSYNGCTSEWKQPELGAPISICEKHTYKYPKEESDFPFNIEIKEK